MTGHMVVSLRIGAAQKALLSGGMSADLAQDIVSPLCPPATVETPLDVSSCADVAPIGEGWSGCPTNNNNIRYYDIIMFIYVS